MASTWCPYRDYPRPGITRQNNLTLHLGSPSRCLLITARDVRCLVFMEWGQVTLATQPGHTSRRPDNAAPASPFDQLPFSFVFSDRKVATFTPVSHQVGSGHSSHNEIHTEISRYFANPSTAVILPQISVSMTISQRKAGRQTLTAKNNSESVKIRREIFLSFGFRAINGQICPYPFFSIQSQYFALKTISICIE